MMLQRLIYAQIVDEEIKLRISTLSEISATLANYLHTCSQNYRKGQDRDSIRGCKPLGKSSELQRLNLSGCRA